MTIFFFNSNKRTYLFSGVSKFNCFACTFFLKLSAVILQQHLLASGLLSYLHKTRKQVSNLEQRKSKRIKETYKNFLLMARFCKLLALEVADSQQKTAQSSDEYQVLLKELDLSRI